MVQRMALILGLVGLLTLGGTLLIQLAMVEQSLPTISRWAQGAASPAEAADLLWQIGSRTALMLLTWGALMAALAAWALKRWQQPLMATLAQLQALQAGRLLEIQSSPVPELRDLAQGINQCVLRLRRELQAQAQSLAQAQHQLQFDAVTGLAQRSHFLAQLRLRLAEPGGASTGLLLLRLRDLAGLNLRVGRESADQLLRTVAEVLMIYVDRVPGARAGRLNGSDFALCLPATGVALETARSLREALAMLPAMRSAAAQIVVGGVDGLPQTGLRVALSAADAALASAEAGEGLPAGVVVAHQAESPLAVHSASEWRDQIIAALGEGRVRLDERPVIDRAGGRLLLACPLAVQLDPFGEFEPAPRWSALARRGRLLPQLDLEAIRLALLAIRRDGLPRAVRVSAPAMASPGFVADVAALLNGSKSQARRLWLEIAEAAQGELEATLPGVIEAWRDSGVRFGVEHAGAAPHTLLALQAAGFEYVTLDGGALRGLSQDGGVQAYVSGLVSLIQGLGMKALAEGLDDQRDLAALWALGLDGAQAPSAAFA